jgi:nucleotidyltransferase/DNA polymerase involved in DNA repair
VGKVAQKNLEKVGIHTIRDIRRTPLAQLETMLGSYAARLRALAQGIDDRPVVSDGEARSISAENTFARDIADADELRAHLDRLSERVGRRVRKSGYEAYTVHLKARYADFTTVTRAMTLAEPTAQTPAIRDAARELLEVRLGRRGRALRLLGVGVSNLVHAGTAQPLLIEDDRSRKNRELDGVMDSLQEKFGTDAIHRGSGVWGVRKEWEADE